MKQTHTGVVEGKPIYYVSLCQQRDRYIVEIDGDFVLHDKKEPTDDGKGAINVLCPGNRRGWYNLKDVKAFCENHAERA